MQQLREALKILAERVLILEHMIGIHGRNKKQRRWKSLFQAPGMLKRKVDILGMCARWPFRGQLDE